jgi:hypothetical protein
MMRTEEVWNGRMKKGRQEQKLRNENAAKEIEGGR